MTPNGATLAAAVLFLGFGAAAQAPMPAVIKPPPVDPSMRVKPPAKAKLPTPVITPRRDRGNTVVVPK